MVGTRKLKGMWGVGGRGGEGGVTRLPMQETNFQDLRPRLRSEMPGRLQKFGQLRPIAQMIFKLARMHKRSIENRLVNVSSFFAVHTCGGQSSEDPLRTCQSACGQHGVQCPSADYKRVISTFALVK